MKKINVILAAAAGVLCLAVWLQHGRIGRLAKERDRYAANSDALMSDITRRRLDSATMATDVKSLRLTVDELERYRAADAAKIKQMGVKIKNLQAAAKHEINIDAPIKAAVRDSVIIRDSVASAVQRVWMENPFIRLQGVIAGDSLVGSVQLPVTIRQAVWIEYKRRWLFWKKVKAVHQTITSDNPYVEIKYSEYITIQKR